MKIAARQGRLRLLFIVTSLASLALALLVMGACASSKAIKANGPGLGAVDETTKDKDGEAPTNREIEEGPGDPRRGSASGKKREDASEDKAKIRPEAKPAAKPSKEADSKMDDVAMDRVATTELEKTDASDSSTKEAWAGSLGGGERDKPSESGLQAGYSDDNDQYNYFLRFLEQYGPQVNFLPLKIQERIGVRILDADGKALANAELELRQAGQDRILERARSYANGLYQFYPQELGDAGAYVLKARVGQASASLNIDRAGPRTLELRLGQKRQPAKELPLDLLFVLDTTGSMGNEIQRLQNTIEIINDNVLAMSPRPKVRFGLVLYRDKLDEYRTRTVPFTDDLKAFSNALYTVDAGGGGDTPEDLQAGLDEAIHSMDWNKDGLRLAFVITDAAAHLDYGQAYTYADAAKDAKSMAIKFYTVGTGGLDLDGEYVLRQLAQYSQARYIFLTYGEKGESDGGGETSVSHHSGSNFQTGKLEAIIIRFAQEELSFQSEKPIKLDESYFGARKVDGEKREDTLAKLFSDALANLADYSTMRVTKESKLAILPIALSEQDGGLKAQAEFFSEAMLLSALRSKSFTVVERKDLQKILEEQELQYSGLVDEGTAAKIGGILGSDVLLTSRLYAKDGGYEIFIKLLRVETGEVLAVTKLKIQKELGL